MEIKLLFGKPRPQIQIIPAITELRKKHPQCVIQALDADKVVSFKHIDFAVEKAMRAICEGQNVAKDHGLEIMRYASGQRQIEKAFLIGISPSTKRIALVIVGDVSSMELDEIIERDELGYSFSEEMVRQTFDISDQEVEAVGREKIPKLVLERVALVDAYR